MKQYDSDHIKNVVLLGHQGSGKTTLAEDMLFEAGVINRRGSIEDKNTVSDYNEMEQERQSSIYCSVMHFEWKNCKINLLDTPGFDDFAGEAAAALKVADTALLTVHAQHAVEVGTGTMWEYAKQQQKPLMFTVNHVDHENANFEMVLEQLRSNFGRKVTPLQYPLNPGQGFNAIVDVLRMLVYKFPEQGGKPEKQDIPEEEAEKANRLHNELVETVAEVDDSLMELFFDKGTLSEEELAGGLKLALKQREIFPVFCTAAKRNMGSGRIMGFISNVAPSASEMPPAETEDGNELPCSARGPVCLQVFKSISEANLGDMAFFKLYSGTLTTGMDLFNYASNNSERINQIYIVNGKNRTGTEKILAGDIGATVKLKHTHTNETLCEKGNNTSMPPIVFPEPTVRTAIALKSKGQEDKLANALKQIREENPSIRVEYSPELKQTILHTQGELQLNLIKQGLAKQKIEIGFKEPKIPYRETIQKEANAMYRHKKQTGGAGQFAEVHMRICPYNEHLPDPPDLKVRNKELIELPWGGCLEYVNCIVGGSIDARFMPAILKGVMEKMEDGPITGSRVRDVRVIVYDGKMHPVDSNDMAFKLAGRMAFRDAFKQADPVLLEPIYEVEVLVPDEMRSEVMSDLQTKRAIVQGMDMEGQYQKITAKVPLAELHNYTSTLRSLTQGMARYRQKFDAYQRVPFEIQQKLASEREEESVEA